MARACDGCRLLVTDHGSIACPRCGVVLRAVELDPEPHPHDEPLVDRALTWLGAQPGLLVGAVGLSLGLAAVNGGSGGGGGPSPRPEMAVIRPGMSAAEVARLLAADRKWIAAGGRPEVPADGEIAYDRDGARTTVVLSGGRVVEVEENDGPGAILRTRTRAAERP